tara:strand:+ start:6491 stop:7516 length:1026 start_codon:yes stop_codon:yes gene_type:complete
MDITLKQQLDKFGLSGLVDFVYDNIGISNLDDLEYFDLDDPDYHEEFNKLSTNNKNSLLLFIRTIQTANKVSNKSNYQSSQDTSIALSRDIGINMRSCYIGILSDLSKSITERKEYFYDYFIKPHIPVSDEDIDKEFKINFEGRTHVFNQNTISIGRGSQQYPVDIVIKERYHQDLSISRVNCLIFRVNTPEGIVYHLFDAWSLIETRLTKTNPIKTFKTSKDDPNILSWNENENIYISCGDPLCTNKIHFISSTDSNKDAETINSEIEEITSDEDLKSSCVICFKPANIRLGCGHAVYCSNDCMDTHVAYQKQETGNAVCPFCKENNIQNKQSLCIEQYK